MCATSEVLAAFDSAIRLDSGFALSYLHAIEVSFALDSAERAKRYATAYYANRPPGVRMDWVGFAMQLIDPKKAFVPTTRHSLETLSNDDLLGARLIVDRYPIPSRARCGSAGRWRPEGRLTRRALRAATGGHEPKRELAERLAFRGHFRSVGLRTRQRACRRRKSDHGARASRRDFARYRRAGVRYVAPVGRQVSGVRVAVVGVAPRFVANQECNARRGLAVSRLSKSGGA